MSRTNLLELQQLQNKIPYKWRVQSFSKYKAQATCVAYVDARDIQNLLDTTIGAHNWQDDYKTVDGKLFAGIGIRVSDPTVNALGQVLDSGWVWKWDTGTESQTEADKGKVSDAFKRAAVKWGCARFVYSVGVKYVDANEKKTGSNNPHCIDKNRKKIYDLSAHFGSVKQPPQAPDKVTPQADGKPQGKGRTVADVTNAHREQYPTYNDNKLLMMLNKGEIS